jgi:large subunit ribosomal protein L4
MPTVKIHNVRGEVVGELELSEDVFGAEVKPHLHWEVVRAQRAARRQGTHATKTRSTVSGTTKKVYRQKGTGNARHGSRKSPVYVGGGVSHGPQPRKYAFHVPKKVRRAALCSALSTRVRNGELVVVDAFGFEQPKTRQAVHALRSLGVANGLVVAAVEDAALHLSMRNIPFIKYIRAEGVNVYDVLKYDRLVLTVDSVRALETRLG